MMVNCHLNIDIDDFLHTPDGRWDKSMGQTDTLFT